MRRLKELVVRFGYYSCNQSEEDLSTFRRILRFAFRLLSWLSKPGNGYSVLCTSVFLILKLFLIQPAILFCHKLELKNSKN